jgi:hypothetical protein
MLQLVHMGRYFKALIQVALLVVIIGGAYLVVLHRYDILDWYHLRNYTPPAQVAALSDQATMTDLGRRLFYRAQPDIMTDRQQLAGACHIQDSKTIELGCYLTNDKIYLLSITEPDLSDEMVVTAAHETLHAAYDRLSGSDRRQIDALLESAASSIKDPRLEQRLADYQQLEPGERDNELHSILGTEYSGLPPELEQHYAKYFSKRSQVVAYSDRFNQTFDGLHEEITSLDKQIKTEKSQMDSLLSRGQIEAYNYRVPAVNNDINEYNDKVERYNRYASQLLGTETTAAAQ